MIFKDNAKIKSIEFSIWPADEIKKFAVAEINKSNSNGPNTIYDTRMGVTTNKTLCSTCGNGIIQCPGHFGCISLTCPVAHPLFINEIIQYLKCFCDKCYQLRLTTDQLTLLGLEYLKVNTPIKQQVYFTSLLEQVSKIDNCPYCKCWLPSYYQNDGTIYKYKNGNKELNVQISDTEILQIFSNISRDEINKLGIYNSQIHPVHLIITVLPVLPPCARPPAVTDGGTKDDDLTFQYIEIIKINNKLSAQNLSEITRQTLIDQLKMRIHTLSDNSRGLAKQINGRPIKAIKARLNGKTGLIRWHLSGKRVNDSARSVIGPDPNLETDEIALPYAIASTQRFPEKVYAKNKDYLQNLVNSGKANHVVRNGNERKDLKYIMGRSFKILNDDIIFSNNTSNNQMSCLDYLTIKQGGNIAWNAKFLLIQNIIDQAAEVGAMNTSFVVDKLPGITVIKPFEYAHNKKKPYVLKKGDFLLRYNIIFCDLAAEGFTFERGDFMLNKDEPIKIEAYGLSDNQPVYLYKDKQVVLENGDILKRMNTYIGNMQIEFKQKSFELKIGDVVERHLQSGDLIAFGRQPSLHKGSLLARKVRVIDESTSNINNGKNVKTIRMNLAVTKTYNADFDGDEMNVYSSQSLDVAAEMKFLASTEANIKSGQNSRLLVSLHQDALTGGYMATKQLENSGPNITRSKLLYCLNILSLMHPVNINLLSSHLDQNCFNLNELKTLLHALDNKGHLILMSIVNSIHKTVMDKALFFDCCCDIIQQDIHNLTDKIQHIKDVLKWKGVDAIEDDDIYNAHCLFSMILPDDFEYTCTVGDDNIIAISRGVLLCGTLCKTVLGDNQSSIIHILEKEYSATTAMNFVTNYQFLINHWLMHRGFSIGISDCLLKEKTNTKQAIDKSFLEANLIAITEKDEFIKESRVNNALNTANTIGQKLCKNATAYDNSFKDMIVSGAKGNYVNIAQITGLLGQQNITGGRVEKSYNGRTLPHCLHEDQIAQGLTDEQQLTASLQLYRSRGFIQNSYYQKLHPIEFFFHAQSGREGVSDTAVKTSSTGYSQRKLIKFLEDLKYNYGSSVTNAREMIVQFTYGQSLDPSKMLMINKRLQFVNVGSIVNKLNADVEWSAAAENSRNLT